MKVNVDLPLAAAMIKGMIEQQLRQEIAGVLIWLDAHSRWQSTTATTPRASYSPSRLVGCNITAFL